MAELGKIEKPEAEYYQDKRKIYLVPLIFCGDKAPQEYVALFKRYWEQVGQHVANLESKIGKVSHIYYESIAQAGEDGLKLVERLNSTSLQIIKEKCQGGAVLEATEDMELVEESMDWERCIFMGFLSQKVAKIASESYLQALKQRYEYIARKIDETLQPSEAGLLFIQEGHMVQFRQDIEVFSVAPTALDEIHRWQRDRLSQEKKGEPEDERD